ncbi:B-box zinc finger protein 20-like [Rutidosis leptorrhynchoides]|uniref:B-box zinc finger protein 20-like n=1 Tax=Rutidosis leptorrhynchoides TaxID=125765 RepID=UPI003A99D085
MKIQCDVCNEHEASVYCSADEAALCAACDHRVHHANKLAGKHPRFSLHHPSTPKESPLCDICQEKKAFLFCQQDRAILCNNCDVAIHKVNQHTQTHNRFLLTGVKLSSTSTLYSDSTPFSDTKKGVFQNKQQKTNSPPIINQPSSKTQNCPQESNGSGHGSDTSSISEYLIEMLPGWHVEDFLDPLPMFPKKLQNEPTTIWGDHLLDASLNGSFSGDSMGTWVPQAPPQPAGLTAPSRYNNPVQQFEQGSNMGFGDQISSGSSLVFGQDNYKNYNNNINKRTKSSREWTSDYGNCFMVPQISPPPNNSKRSRTLWS